MMKGISYIICISMLLVLSGIGCKTESQKTGSQSIKIGALFSKTGGLSLLGLPEANTAEMIVAELNAKGGINGSKVELVIKDTGGNAEKALSMATQLIEEDKVLAIIGPSSSGESLKIKELCENTKTILLSCAAAEGIVDPVAKYVFKTPQKDNYVVEWIYKTMNDMGIKNIGVTFENNGFGQSGKAQLEKYAKQYGITIALAEGYATSETDLTAVMTKVKEKNVEAVVNWSVFPAQSIMVKNMRQIGMKQPLFQSHGFGNIKYVETAGEAAEGIIFPAGRLLIADSLPDDHPQKALLMKYKTDYQAKYGEAASTFGGHAYDSLKVLFKAIEDAKSTDKEKVRDAIENLKGFVGTAGEFNFSPTDHNGLGMDSISMITVKGGKFVPYVK